MSLTKEFFDNIQIELVKRKYYNSNKVDAVLSDVRNRARTLMEENGRLSAELATLTSQKAEIAEAVMNAQLLHSDIVQKANRHADDKAAEAEERAQAIIAEAEERSCEIVAEAQAQAQRILEEAQAQAERVVALENELSSLRQHRQEYIVDKVEACFSMFRQQHMDAIDRLNLQWQQFLCGLYEEDAFHDESTEIAPAVDTLRVEDMPPADLGEKLGEIAKELDSLKLES